MKQQKSMSWECLLRDTIWIFLFFSFVVGFCGNLPFSPFSALPHFCLPFFLLSVLPFLFFALLSFLFFVYVFSFFCFFISSICSFFLYVSFFRIFHCCFLPSCIVIFYLCINLQLTHLSIKLVLLFCFFSFFLLVYSPTS